MRASRRKRAKVDGPKVLYRGRLPPNSDKFVQDVLVETETYTFKDDKDEQPPNTHETGTHESFPKSAEIKNRLMNLLRPKLQPVLIEWQGSHPNIEIDLDFEDDAVRTRLYTTTILIIV